MPRFLEQLAKVLLQQHGTELADVAVVLPSKRAGQFLVKELVALAEPPFWSPVVLTFNELLNVIAGLDTIDTTSALLELYPIHCDLANDAAQPLAEFLKWAPTTLRDISEMESHLLDLEQTYVDLRNIGGIEDWSFSNDELSTGQRSLQRTWAQQAKLHDKLCERLLQKGLGLAGMVERKAVEAIDSGARPPYKQVYFAGINALTPAQRRIMKVLVVEKLATLAWDVDRYYLDRPEQEAGEFLRKNLPDLGKGAIPISERLTTMPRQLKVHGIPNGIAMAQHAAGLIAAMRPDELEHTVVVLCDEGMLGPLLDALPNTVGAVNITMGLPVGQMPMATLFEQWYQLLLTSKPGLGIERRTIINFLDLPLIKEGLGDALCAAMTGRITKSSRAHIRWESLQGIIAELDQDGSENVALLFRPTENDDLFARSVAFIKWVKTNVELDKFSTEQLFRLSRLFERLHLQIDRHGIQLDMHSFHRFWRRGVQQEKLDLFGEPLQGLQVMGLLETRSIDLPRVIMLSANEGFLPPTNVQRSFVPYDVRRVFGLPGRQDADAIMAYNFLRMLHGCTQLDMLYVDSVSGNSGGPSRFIKQLEMELCRLPGQEFVRTSVEVPIQHRPKANLVIPTTAFMIERCKEKIKNGLSPSAIGTYLNCPLDFYFKYLMRLKEENEISAAIAANELGTAVHSTFDRAYGRFQAEGKVISADAIQEVIKEMPKLFDHVLKEEGLAHHRDGGRSLLTLRIAVQAMESVLQNELSAVKKGDAITILGIEQKLQHSFTTETGLQATLGGRIDRVERRNGDIVVVDYKTGSATPAELKVATLELDEFRKKGKHKAMQLLVYAWAYLNNDQAEDQVQARILSLRKPSSYPGMDLVLEKEAGVHREQLPRIETMFNELIAEMLDPQRTWQHNEQNEYCSFCIKP